MLAYTFQPLTTFGIVVALVLALDPVARRFELLDRPSGRKSHPHAVPVTGGIAMSAGFIVPALLLGAPGAIDWGLIVGLSGLVALGTVDDLIDLGPWTKLAGQFAAALAITLSTHHLTGLGELLGLGFLAAQLIETTVSTLFVVGLANAFNMLDGLDGLAGGVAVAVLAGLAAIAAVSGMSGALMQILLLLAAVLGFLAFNAPHPWRASAAVFMGDAGSLMLGAAIASFMLDVAASPVNASPVPALLWLVALPGFDMVILIVRRLIAGQSPFRADRQHVHHTLLQAGFTPPVATVVLVAACGLLGGAGIAGWHAGVPNIVLFSLLLVPFATHLYLVLHGWRVLRRLGTSPTTVRTAAVDPMAPPGARTP